MTVYAAVLGCPDFNFKIPINSFFLRVLIVTLLLKKEGGNFSKRGRGETENVCQKVRTWTIQWYLFCFLVSLSLLMPRMLIGGGKEYSQCWAVTSKAENSTTLTFYSLGEEPRMGFLHGPNVSNWLALKSGLCFLNICCVFSVAKS